MSHSRLPVKDPIPSVWTGQPHPLDDYQSTPNLLESCDILIVGSGFAGVATAYHILKDRSCPPSVVLLDARKHVSGATGRNGGHVKPDTYYNVSKYERIYGTQQAAELAKFESSGVLATKQLVETEGLDCDFHLTRAVDVYMDPQHATQTVAAYKRLLKRGEVDMADVEYTSKRAAERVKTPRTFPRSRWANQHIHRFRA
jgi:glycine/D-amino acid oxidase-like deaminating enzyme